MADDGFQKSHSLLLSALVRDHFFWNVEVLPGACSSPKGLLINLGFLINLRAKRGGSLFEAGSEREENGGVTSVRKRCAR